MTDQTSASRMTNRTKLSVLSYTSRTKSMPKATGAGAGIMNRSLAQVKEQYEQGNALPEIKEKPLGDTRS